MAIKDVVARGYLGDTIKNVVTRGYDIGTIVPVFIQIVDKIETLINAYMTQANGFSLDYGSVNEYDYTALSYPAVYLEYLEEEDFAPDLIERFNEMTELAIRVKAASSDDLGKTAHRIISDFGLLMDNFKNTLKGVGLVDYIYIDAETNYNNISAYPIEVITHWQIYYRRTMNDLYAIDTGSTDDIFSGSAWSSSTPIIDSIMGQIKTQIATMTKANGYSVDYGSINEHDYTARTYPAVFLRVPNEYAETEDEDQQYGRYSVHAPLEIEVRCETSKDLNKTVMKIRNDFAKMYVDDEAVLRAAGLLRSVYVGSSIKNRLISAYPVTIILNYILYHRRQRTNPYLT